MAYGPPPIAQFAATQYPPPYVPPRRSNRGIVLALSATLFVVVLAIVTTLVVLAIDDESDSAATAPTATSRPSTSKPRTTRPSPSLTATRLTRGAATTTGQLGAPKLGDNPLFANSESGLPGIRCAYPTWSTAPDDVERYFRQGIACLDQEWQPVLEKAGLPSTAPTLVVPRRGEQFDSPCGSSSDGAAAFYCSTNDTIYMPLDTIQLDRYPDQPVILLALLAHEYGHHVQSVSGVLEAAHQQRRDQGPKTDAGYETQRRTELGAECFGGMYVGAGVVAGTFDATQGSAAIEDNYGRGDDPGGPRSHGTNQNVGLWFEKGYRSNSSQQCNTWLSPADDVA